MVLTASLPTSLDANAVAEITARLDGIRSIDGVAIPLAVESGSRAWGFPSPDSDYDCRFVFVRPVDQYLSPWPRRDVIETPLDALIDVNGWDLGKAIRLLLKGNAVIVEWLTSPIAYGVDEEFRRMFLDLAKRVAERNLIARHYLHLGVRQRNAYFADHKDVALKKLFYAVRPAAALRWLRQRPNAVIAPMHFQTLFGECDPPADVAEIIEDLIERKAVTRELGSAPLPAAVAQFVDDEFVAAEAAFPKTAAPRDGAADLADRFFRDALKHVWSATRPTWCGGE